MMLLLLPSLNKTRKPVQFEITEQTRDSLNNLIYNSHLYSQDYLFKSRLKTSEHLSSRKYALIVKEWVSGIGLDPMAPGTYSMRRMKSSLIYKQKKI